MNKCELCSKTQYPIPACAECVEKLEAELAEAKKTAIERFIEILSLSSVISPHCHEEIERLKDVYISDIEEE